MTDQQIIQALIDRNDDVTEQFFFKDCRPLFVSVIHQVFVGYDIDYDEFVNELYIHIMENGAQRLRQFQGRSTVYQWLKVVAIHYFWAKKKKIIDESRNESLMEKTIKEEGVESTKNTTARMDVESLMEQMTNPRQVYAIRRLILQDIEPERVAKEMNVTVDNLYNIKKRALDALAKIALKS